MRDKTEAPGSEGSEQSLPFFARFLEGQESSRNSIGTLKFPSDSDEEGNFEYTPRNNGPRE
jgi:hypothetical protein